ncbi:MAG: hypothetical protein WA085_05265 [Sphingobium sp.]
MEDPGRHRPVLLRLADVCREAVNHCNILRVGIDLSFRDDIIEARPGNDPAQLANIFERRAAERAKPVGRRR